MRYAAWPGAMPRCCWPITARWWRKSLEAAVFATEELEETAKLYLLLRNMNPHVLSPGQIADLAKVFKLHDLAHPGEDHHDHG